MDQISPHDLMRAANYSIRNGSGYTSNMTQTVRQTNPIGRVWGGFDWPFKNPDDMAINLFREWSSYRGDIEISYDEVKASFQATKFDNKISKFLLEKENFQIVSNLDNGGIPEAAGLFSNRPSEFLSIIPSWKTISMGIFTDKNMLTMTDLVFWAGLDGDSSTISEEDMQKVKDSAVPDTWA